MQVVKLFANCKKKSADPRHTLSWLTTSNIPIWESLHLCRFLKWKVILARSVSRWWFESDWANYVKCLVPGCRRSTLRRYAKLCGKQNQWQVFFRWIFLGLLFSFIPIADRFIALASHSPRGPCWVMSPFQGCGSMLLASHSPRGHFHSPNELCCIILPFQGCGSMLFASHSSHGLCWVMSPRWGFCSHLRSSYSEIITPWGYWSVNM